MSELEISLVVVAGGLVLIGIAFLADSDIYEKDMGGPGRPFKDWREAVALFCLGLGSIAVAFAGVTAFVLAIT